MAKNKYLSGQPIICQLLSFIPKDLVDQSTSEHQSDRYYKTMTTFKQLVFVFYGVVMRCKSLNNLCKNLLLLEDKLTYLGIKDLPAVSTLSDANINRNSDVFGFCLFTFMIGSLQAQRIENIDVQLVNENIILSFDLLPQESIAEKYDLAITSSIDGHKKPLQVKNGSVSDVAPKNRLQYTIDGIQNLGDFKGEVKFRIKATLTYSPLRILSPKDKISVKKGKTLELSWAGGNNTSEYNIELYKSNVLSTTIESKNSSKKSNWKVPKNFRTGNDYKIKIAVDGKENQSVFTKQFTIKRKIPILIKVMPLVVAGGVFALISGGGGSDPDPVIPIPPDLPD